MPLINRVCPIDFLRGFFYGLLGLLGHPHRRLHPRAQVELLEQVLDVDLDRALGDIQVTGDKLVAQALGKQLEDLPFALDELEFLLACTRCGECEEACPHGVIFTLSPRLGAQVAATPALDLLHKGCHLCEDWPCISACEPQALKRAEPDDDSPPSMPMLAMAEIDTRTCLPFTGPECGACRGSCPVPGAMEWDMDKPHIVGDRCIGCALCWQACIVEPKAIGIRSTVVSN